LKTTQPENVLEQNETKQKNTFENVLPVELFLNIPCTLQLAGKLGIVLCYYVKIAVSFEANKPQTCLLFIILIYPGFF